MKTALFSTMYLDGNDLFGNNRLERNIRYVQYYEKLKTELGFSSFIFCDNASSMGSLASFDANIVSEGGKRICKGRDDVTVIRFDRHLARGLGFDYPYCWRGLYHMGLLARRGLFDKFIFCDTDAYILSGEMAEYIKNLKSGWETFWCPRYNFPECAIMVICRDQFQPLIDFIGQDYMKHNNVMMETALPYTKVNKQFVGDRYGEDNCLPKKKIDYCCQTPLSVSVSFSPSNRIEG